MTFSDYMAEDPFETKPARKKKPKPRPKRCINCRSNVESDGHAGYVHSGTEEWPAVFYGCQYFDESGYPIFIRPTDERFRNVATV